MSLFRALGDASPLDPPDQSALNHLKMEETVNVQLCSLIILPNSSEEPHSWHRVPQKTRSLQGPVSCTNIPFAFASL